MPARFRRNYSSVGSWVFSFFCCSQAKNRNLLVCGNPVRTTGMNGSCYRQGDVFLISVTKLPSADSRHSRSAVLAEGEVTGHAHRFRQAKQVEVFSSEERLYVEVLSESAELVHQEHGTIGIPRGGYEVRIQREYTPRGIQRVVD